MPVSPATSYGTQYPMRAVNSDPNGIGVEFSAGVSATRDGTPSRVAGALLIAGATLAALKLLGFRFNVGVSS